jgi:peptidoglycan/LPS O-acetylase OafA/YrhL
MNVMCARVPAAIAIRAGDSPKEIYYPGFDYLRLLLALLVAASHAGLVKWEYAGGLAVQIFFALSGWLIAGILLRSELASLPRFYFNRAARIWIPYFVALALLILASLLKDPITSKWLEFVFYKATFVYNIFGTSQLNNYAGAMPLAGTGNHFWSVCAEEQFYLAAPILIILLPFGKTVSFWLALTLALAFSPFWIYFASISTGVLAATIHRTFEDWHLPGLVAGALAASVILLTGAVYLDLLSFQYGGPLIGVSTVLLLARKGARSPIATFVGGISYPLYLNHWIGLLAVNAVTKRLNLPIGAMAQMAMLAIAVLVASMLYAFVDKPIKLNRDLLYTRPRGISLAVIAIGSVSLGVVGAFFIYHAPL